MQDRLANTAAERDILGSILTAPADLHKVSGIIKTEDFYRQDYRLIFDCMKDFILQDSPLNVVTLCEELRKRGDLEKVGGVRNISDLASTGRCWSMQQHAEIIADYSRRRRLVEKAHELEALAVDSAQDVDDITASFCEDFSGISRKADNHTANMSEAIMELMSTLERRKRGDILSTGLKDLDRIITGFEPGQLVTIAGRPGDGKSALAGTIAVNMAQRGKKILMFSLEMGKGELAGRFLSRIGGIDGSRMKRPEYMTDEEKSSLLAGMKELEPLPITINTQGNLTPSDIASIASRIKRTSGLDVVIVDYVQLMASGKKSDNRVQEVSYITRSLKGLATILDVPILMLSQLSRSNVKEKRRPALADLRDSGSIEQDSNTVLLLDHVDGDKTSIIVAKQRNGETGECCLLFNTKYGYFSNYDYNRDIPL